MCVFLRAKDHSQLLTKEDLWSNKPETARKFTNGAEALRYSADHHLDDAEILYSFENPLLNFAVSIADIQFNSTDDGFGPRP